MKRDKKEKGFNSVIMDYFSEKNFEIFQFDTTKKDDFEIFESLRIYIERVKNYIINDM